MQSRSNYHSSPWLSLFKRRQPRRMSSGLEVLIAPRRLLQGYPCWTTMTRSPCGVVLLETEVLNKELATCSSWLPGWLLCRAATRPLITGVAKDVPAHHAQPG